MKIILESKPEDELYFEGAFWVKGDSLKSITDGNFELIIGSKILVDFEGNPVEKSSLSKNDLTHRRLWNKVGDEHSWDYYPRGRVSICQGVAYIHINSICSTNKLWDAIIKEYQISKLTQRPDFNNEYQGSHYNFKLQ